MDTSNVVAIRLKDGLSADDLRLYLQALEDEHRKIEAFKRELPLSMSLVNDAIEAIKLGMNDASSILRLGLLPSDDDLSSVSKQTGKRIRLEEQTSGAVRPQAIPGALKLNGSGGAFSPFVRMSHHAEQQQHETPAVSPARSSTGADQYRQSPTTSATHTMRKSRRCWSEELHQRFLNALEQLGGSRATPKQIREIMKVDGLTNDEVKSHLQKYRLHTRRPDTEAQPPQLLIWMPPEFAQSQGKLREQAIQSLVECGTKAFQEEKQQQARSAEQQSSESESENDDEQKL